MTQAFAQTTPSAPAAPVTTAATGAPAAPASTGNIMAEQAMSFLPLILIFGIFYMLIIRPQQQKLKDHRSMVKGLQRGDKIVTAGGLLGTVSSVVNDNEVAVDLADNVRVRVVRHTISQILTDERALASNAPVNDDAANPHHKRKAE